MDNLEMGAELVGEVRLTPKPHLESVLRHPRQRASAKSLPVKGTISLSLSKSIQSHQLTIPPKKASHVIHGDYTFSPDAAESRHLLAGATSFFHSLKHQYDGDYDEGLQSADAGFTNEWGRENKSVFMFSGCKDEQTSADAFINGRHVGKQSTI